MLAIRKSAEPRVANYSPVGKEEVTRALSPRLSWCAEERCFSVEFDRELLARTCHILGAVYFTHNSRNGMNITNSDSVIIKIANNTKVNPVNFTANCEAGQPQWGSFFSDLAKTTADGSDPINFGSLSKIVLEMLEKNAATYDRMYAAHAPLSIDKETLSTAAQEKAAEISCAYAKLLGMCFRDAD